MNQKVRTGHWYNARLTFWPGDGTEYEVKLAPIAYLSTNLQTMQVRKWWQRWRSGTRGAWK